MTSVKPATFGSWRRRSAISWIALACSSLLTLLAWDVSARSVRGRLRDHFTLRTDKIVRGRSDNEARPVA